jgi:branched-chain amino acid transport system ATP-binding protein
LIRLNPALDDFAVPQGEFRAVIGPNGAGKSTFFKLIAGLHTPSLGHIEFDGEDITDLIRHERARRGISIKFQKVSIYPDIPIRENIRIPVQRRHSGKLQTERIEELLELIGLRDRADQPAARLSHGEQQWLEIAMAMAIEPKLLLLDEPTAGMTIEETSETAKLIRSLVEEGITIIVVEHDLNFVRELSASVSVLHNGGIFAEGTIEEIEQNEDVQRVYLGEQ